MTMFATKNYKEKHNTIKDSISIQIFCYIKLIALCLEYIDKYYGHLVHMTILCLLALKINNEGQSNLLELKGTNLIIVFFLIVLILLC